MKRKLFTGTMLPLILLALLGIVLTAAGVIWMISSGHTPALLRIQAPAPPLENPDFEDGFHYWQDIGQLLVADGWQPWWVEGGSRRYYRPEWKPEQVGVGRGRVRQGSYAQKQFTTFAPHDAGLWQRVGVEPGKWYVFSAWVYVWSSDHDNPDESRDPGFYRVMVGVSPWGREYVDDTVIWGSEYVDAYDRWLRVSVEFRAWHNTAVLFTRGNPLYGKKHNDSYWDTASFQLMQVSEATCPAPTPYPTYTPLPTYTPYPTYTPVVCPSGTPGVCPDLSSIRSVVETVVAGREPERWPR